MAESHNGDTKDRIIEVATKLFSEKGYDGAKMNEIAKETEINKASIYYYFPTKQSILDHIIESFFSDIMRISSDTILESIRRMVETGKLDIFPDRMSFAAEDDLISFRKDMTKYYKSLAEYMLGNRLVLHIILSEALRDGEHKATLFRFFLMAHSDKGNPLFADISLAGSGSNYGRDIVFRKFFFSLMPMINFAVFYDDYKTVSGMSDDEMLNAYLRSLHVSAAPYILGREVIIDASGDID